MTSGRRQTVVAVLLAVVLGVGAFWAARYWQAGKPAYQRLSGPADCRLEAGPCEAVLASGEVRASIDPLGIPLMTTLTLAVDLDAIDAENVIVDIRGLNMDMGLNRTRLARDAAGTWRGETILPVCSQRRMEWEAAVQIDGAARIEVPFRFHTVRP
jgi:hypothetical protein